ncbi:hypothetical protein CQW23_23550 [Capsicum baccatum]|uniref:Transposase MuDR plant domain-containing protein n=1 Tax=Capsicum baccatum TaxID=33114 RepID=A0A2G2VS95_CAPBA|nr:hypothetical protein CQW23_23550 [Capsicum baccatum]
MDENEMSIESIDRNNELQVIEQILEAEIVKPSKIKRVRQKKRILDVKTTLLRHNASLNEVNVKLIFIDKQNMMTCMSNIAIRHNIQFKVIKSSTTRYSLQCLDDNYVWQFHASKIVNSLLFQVTTYEKAHSCSVDFITSNHRNATSKVIYDYILELVRDSSNVITPNFMVDEIRRKYGIIISYNKEWQAIQHAYKVIRGIAEENYNRLPSYLHMMKENNPGIYTNIKRDDENSTEKSQATANIGTDRLHSEQVTSLFVADSLAHMLEASLLNQLLFLSKTENLSFVGGDMFQFTPHADATLLKSIEVKLNFAATLVNCITGKLHALSPFANQSLTATYSALGQGVRKA